MKRPAERSTTLRTNAKSYEKVSPEYYFEDGLRKVKPYYFEYQTYAKERWLGRTVLDVFMKEFRDRPAKYYQEAIERRLITVNGKECSLDQRIEQSDLIGHRLHRHEPPITAQPIKILHNENGMLVVDKPGSIPAHPSGRYRFNTLVELLRNDHGFEHVSLINRLDRLTSGICVLATCPITAERLHQQMERGHFRKEYIARVVGEFPEKAKCEEPLKVIEHKLGLVTVDREGGKPSETLFERIATDGRESIVRCRPLTGRTHQIRVHLRWMGFPIVNDHLYNNKVWPTEQPNSAQLMLIARTLLEETKHSEDNALEVAIQKGNDEGILCPECELTRTGPTPENLCIYLHSYRYSCDSWSFETDMPSWSRLE